MSRSIPFWLAEFVLGKYADEVSAKREVRRAFSKYLNPKVLEELANNPDWLYHGGEVREMSFLSCGIRDLYEAVHELGPENPLRFVNRYMTAITDPVIDAHGTVDRYTGRGLMAFWNAPLGDPDHALHACESALAIAVEIKLLTRRLEHEARAEGRAIRSCHAGIGVNTGTCLLGNIGSQQRFGYSAIGYDVDLAARLEQLSATYGVGILIGEATHAAAQGMAVLEVDLIAVRGRFDPIKIYTLLDSLQWQENDDIPRLVSAHAEMLEAYRSQKWALASKRLAQCHRPCGPLAQLYDLYADRIAHLSEHPPGDDWDGVFVYRGN